MRHGASFYFALSAMSLLAGCSGGSAAFAPGPGAVREAYVARAGTETMPKPTATPVVYPFTPGDTFTYRYARTISTSKKGTKSFDGMVTATLSGLGTYDGMPAYTLRTTGSTTNGSASLDYSDYINLVAAGGATQYVEYGYNYKDVRDLTHGVIEHDNTVLTYATPYEYDSLPETPGAGWTEPVAFKETVNDYYHTPENNPNILSGTLTQAQDGSYTASGEQFNVPVTRLLVSSGTGELIEGPASAPVEWSFALPQSSGSGEVIPATESYDGQSATNLVPDWYPGGGAPASPLAIASMTDAGTTKAPTKCGTRAGSVATHLTSTLVQLDPVAGFTLTDVQQFYVVPGVGYICKLDASVQTSYDNEVTGKVTSIQKTDVTQVLVSEVLK